MTGTAEKGNPAEPCKSIEGIVETCSEACYLNADLGAAARYLFYIFRKVGVSRIEGIIRTKGQSLFTLFGNRIYGNNRIRSCRAKELYGYHT